MGQRDLSSPSAMLIFKAETNRAVDDHFKQSARRWRKIYKDVAFKVLKRKLGLTMEQSLTYFKTVKGSNTVVQDFFLERRK